jgi:hypothetical protein
MTSHLIFTTYKALSIAHASRLIQIHHGPDIASARHILSGVEDFFSFVTHTAGVKTYK